MAETKAAQAVKEGAQAPVDPTSTQATSQTPQTEVQQLAKTSTPAALAGDVEVSLSAPFYTNGVQFGPDKEYGDDEDPTFVTVKVRQDVADDLRRRQAEYDRARRNRFISRRGGQFTPDQAPTA